MASRARRLALDHRGQVVVAGEDFADALPHVRIEPEHGLDVRGGVLVVRIEAAQERMHACALRRRHRAHRLGQDRIGGAVPVQRRIVALVVTRLLRLVLVPLLHHGNAHQHGRIDPRRVHRLEQPGRAFALLEEIDVVQVCIDVAMVARSDAAAGEQHRAAQSDGGERNSAHRQSRRRGDRHCAAAT